jgi:hypothetical protein
MDGASGFILFGLGGKMASFGNLVTSSPWVHPPSFWHYGLAKRKWAGAVADGKQRGGAAKRGLATRWRSIPL